MERREFLLSAGGIVGATAIGSVAYTSATVKRDVTVNVANDDSAIIGLAPGSGATITDYTSGKLTINTNRDTTDSAGLNKNGDFTYGARDSPEFTITNNDDTSHNLSVSLSIGSGSLKLLLYKDDGTYIDTATSTSPGTVNSSYWDAGVVVNAVLVIDTTSMSTGQLTGTITFDAT